VLRGGRRACWRTPRLTWLANACKADVVAARLLGVFQDRLGARVEVLEPLPQPRSTVLVGLLGPDDRSGREMGSRCRYRLDFDTP
jgi:hypothetical protein